MIIPILYSAASIQGVFLALLLLRTKVNQPANTYLALLLLLLSFHLILVGFDNREFFLAAPHLSRISWIIGSLYWPLLFLFVQHITRTQPRNRWMNLWVFVPFIVFLAIMAPYYVRTAAEKRAMLENFTEASKDDFGWINQVMSVLHILFQVFLFAYYVRFERSLYKEFSEVESIRIKWLKKFLLLLFGVTVLAVFAFFARTWELPLLSTLYSFHFIGIVALFYWLSYMALTQPVIFGMVNVADVPAQPVQSGREKYKHSTLDAEQLRLAFERIREVLENRALYLKTDVTLTELSEAADIPRHQASQAINSCYTGNFFDLINDYRINRFKQLAIMEEKKNLTLLGIAQECGFNSKATFYAVFKKKTGMTPSEYIEKRQIHPETSPD